MIRLAAAVAFGALAYLARPKVTRGLGSGEDAAGPFDCTWTNLRFGTFSIEIHYWPEKVVK